MTVPSIRPTVGSGVPTICVARSWNGGALPLGLGQPFELRGGHALPPDRLLAEVGLDWAPELQDLAGQACLEQSLTGRNWFSMAPTVLLGRPGVGRAHAVRRIAQAAGVPFLALNASELDRPLRDQAAACTDVRLPGALVLSIATSGCANPIVFMEGIDEAPEEALATLRAMIDPKSAERWMEQSVGAIIDLRQVTWFLPSSRNLGVPRHFARLPQVDVTCRGAEAERLRALSLISSAMHRLGIGPHEVAAPGASLIAAILEVRTAPVSELELLAERLVMTSAR